MNPKSRIDVHNHFFNIFYVFREVLDISTSFSLDMGRASDRALKDVIKFYLKLLHDATASCSHHYKHLQKAYKHSNAYQGDEIVTVPLMMDIYFALKELLGVSDGARRSDVTAKEVRKTGVHLKRLLITELKKGKSGKSYDIGRTEKKLDKIIEEFETSVNKVRKENMSSGFKAHFNELRRLKKRHPETVFPFFAVDPRRNGVADMVTKYVTKSGPFFGVKLYTRLGYLPSAVDPSIYAYCSVTLPPETGPLQT